MSLGGVSKLVISSVVSEIIALVLAYQASSSFSGNCGDSYSPVWPTLIFVLGSIVLGVIALVFSIKQKKALPIVGSILLVLLSLVAGYYAFFIAAFQLCF